MLIRKLIAVGALCAAALAIASAATTASEQRAQWCDHYAAPWGSNDNPGTFRHPFRTLTHLDRALRPGQTGCLRNGIFGGLHIRHALTNSGRPGARITIRSARGAQPLVKGYIELEGGYTTLSHLHIDGSNTLYDTKVPGVNCRLGVSQPLVIAGPNDTLEYDDYSQSVPGLRGNGIGVGFWGDADNTVIRFNRIHDIGGCQAYDHLIYLSHGNNVQIYDNWMWNDPNGRGVQLYPDPTNARIWDNVIDHAGVGFNIGDEAGTNPAGNEIFDNIVTHSLGLRWEHLAGSAINVYWGGTPAPGNSFVNNISYRNPGGVGGLPGVAAHHNISVNPRLTDPAAHRYSPGQGSPAAAWHMWDGG